MYILKCIYNEKKGTSVSKHTQRAQYQILKIGSGNYGKIEKELKPRMIYEKIKGKIKDWEMEINVVLWRCGPQRESERKREREKKKERD